MPLESATREAQSIMRQARSNFAARVELPAAPAIAEGLSFAPGARVVDLITGLEGVIVDAKSAHVIVATPQGG